MSRRWTWRGRGERWRGAERSDPTRAAAGLVWAAFIVFPIFDAVTGPTKEPRYALVIAGALGFTAGYVRLVLRWPRRSATREIRWLAVALLAIATALTVGADKGWGFLFSYVAACSALAAPYASQFPAVFVIGAVGVGASAARGASAGDAAGYGASALGVGLLLILMRDLRARNIELDEARAELARTAVAAERERFARDLHDLLGHSLSVIAIKAELAGRLLPGAPERAGNEVSDIEGVARAALGEVRDAVSGYRRPTLDGELEGARMALAAAGIIAEFERSPVTLAPDVEAVLAWAVREGATNVIRHSGARHCEVRVHAGVDGAGVEVLDDGGRRGGDGGPGNGRRRDGGIGNGLAGLRERAVAVRGQVEAGAAADGGFRLAVSVPAGERR